MAYQTLADIKTEKARLHKEIATQERVIASLWGELVNPETSMRPKTPTQRLLHYANTAAGMFDGVLFGWKLYRKLSGTTSLLGKKRSRR